MVPACLNNVFSASTVRCPAVPRRCNGPSPKGGRTVIVVLKADTKRLPETSKALSTSASAAKARTLKPCHFSFQQSPACSQQRRRYPTISESRVTGATGSGWSVWSDDSHLFQRSAGLFPKASARFRNEANSPVCGDHFWFHHEWVFSCLQLGEMGTVRMTFGILIGSDSNGRGLCSRRRNGRYSSRLLKRLRQQLAFIKKFIQHFTQTAGRFIDSFTRSQRVIVLPSRAWVIARHRICVVIVSGAVRGVRRITSIVSIPLLSRGCFARNDALSVPQRLNFLQPPHHHRQYFLSPTAPQFVQFDKTLQSGSFARCITTFRLM